MGIRRRWWVTGGILGGVVVFLMIAIAAAHLPYRSETLRKRVVSTLENQLQSKVELESLSLRLLPRPTIKGEGLAIHYHGRADIPPLIAVKTFSVNATFRSLWRAHIGHVELEGLSISIPPKEHREPEEKSETPHDPPDMNGLASRLIIDTVDAPGSEVVILRGDPTKPPRVWAMHSLTLHNVGFHSKMPFETQLTNGVPPGEIDATGSFGPWAAADPGQTPLNGDFTMANADLSVFKGIAGMLASKGSFDGSLEEIVVDGQTSVPDFRLTVAGRPIPLTANYHAIVDGTNGNTTLDPVDARLGQTPILARGGVYDVKDVKGRIVRLDVQMENGRIEDVMHLAVNTPKPPMTGVLHLTTTLVIPPGDVDVVDKLRLDGRFRLERGRFSDPGIQSKINDLSQRATNQLKAASTPEVTSEFAGRFVTRNGRLTLSDLTFDIPGAVVQLDGNYHLALGTIDFAGNVFLDAKVSQLVRGYKSLLLKMADPFFRKEGRTVVPVTISGTRNDPKFSVNIKGALHKGDVKVPPSKTSPSPPRPGTPAPPKGF